MEKKSANHFRPYQEYASWMIPRAGENIRQIRWIPTKQEDFGSWESSLMVLFSPDGLCGGEPEDLIQLARYLSGE